MMKTCRDLQDLIKSNKTFNLEKITPLLQIVSTVSGIVMKRRPKPQKLLKTGYHWFSFQEV